MAEVTTIIRDKRTIESAWSTGPDEVGATIGFENVTKIVPYWENGEMATVAWLAVYRGDVLWKRLNCAHMAEIRYVSQCRLRHTRI